MVWRDFWTRVPARRVLTPTLGVVWWGAVVGAVTYEGRPPAFVEAVMAAGGWGLSLLPVHCVPSRAPGSRRYGRAGRWVRSAVRRR